MNINKTLGVLGIATTIFTNEAFAKNQDVIKSGTVKAVEQTIDLSKATAFLGDEVISIDGSGNITVDISKYDKNETVEVVVIDEYGQQINTNTDITQLSIKHPETIKNNKTLYVFTGDNISLTKLFGNLDFSKYDIELNKVGDNSEDTTVIDKYDWDNTKAIIKTDNLENGEYEIELKEGKINYAKAGLYVNKEARELSRGLYMPYKTTGTGELVPGSSSFTGTILLEYFDELGNKLGELDSSNTKEKGVYIDSSEYYKYYYNDRYFVNPEAFPVNTKFIEMKTQETISGVKQTTFTQTLYNDLD